jgi:hypothetical protein
MLLSICGADNVNAQKAKLHCSNSTIESENDEDSPVLINTCYFKNNKFVTSSYPDAVGRYFPENEEHEVFSLFHGRYRKTKYSSLFNSKGAELLLTINKRIHKEYKRNSTAVESKDCFVGMDSIPGWYRMDDLKISFEGNKILFSVAFGLPSVCRYVDGAVIIFDFGDVVKYFK